MPFTPLASDGLGRRSAIAIGSVIMLGGVAFQICATGVGMVIGARIIGKSLDSALFGHDSSTRSTNQLDLAFRSP